MIWVKGSHSILRIASVSLLVVFLCHVIGFGLPRWFTIQITVSAFDFEGTYHMGLWQECTCSPKCYCAGRFEFKGWHRTVQAMETIGLLGLVISGIICVKSNFWSSTENIRKANLCVLLVSGVCMLIGAVVFAANRYGEYEDLVGNLESGALTETRLDVSFILAILATALCLFLTVPLFVIYLRSSSRYQQNVHNLHDLNSDGAQ